MDVSKVQLANGEVLVDLTNDSVTEETLAEGETAHDASGARITGTMKRGGGVSVQADWNQTDDTAADFIKNKPFGDTPVVILEEQELVYDPEIGGCIAPVSSPIQVGNLIVVADGVSYYTEAYVFNEYVVFGNLSLLEVGADTGEPFAGMYFDGMVMFIFMDGQSHTVEIIKNDVTKLPNRYYDNYCRMYASNRYLYLDAECTIKATKDDAIKAIKLHPIIIVNEHPDAFMLSQSIFAINTGVIGLGNGQGLAVYFFNGGTAERFFTAEYADS